MGKPQENFRLIQLIQSSKWAKRPKILGDNFSMIFADEADEILV